MQDIVETASTGEATDNDDVVVDDTAEGVILLEANPGRKSALITNTGTSPMRVTTDDSSPSPTHGKQIVAGGSLSLSSPYCPTNNVRARRQDATNITANASEVS
jgi:hypothetical protein